MNPIQPSSRAHLTRAKRPNDQTLNIRTDIRTGGCEYTGLFYAYRAGHHLNGDDLKIDSWNNENMLINNTINKF